MSIHGDTGNWRTCLSEHLKSGHTFRRNVQDIDSSGRVSSLSRHVKMS